MTIYGYRMAQKGIRTPKEYDTDVAFINAIQNHTDGHCVIMLHAASSGDIQAVQKSAPENSTIVVVSEAVAAEAFQKDGWWDENVYLLNRSIPTTDNQDPNIVEAFKNFYTEIKTLHAGCQDANQKVLELVKNHIDGKSHIEEKDEALNYILSLGKEDCDN